MSCQACDDLEIVTHVRVGRANVQIAGCREHLRELLETLDAGRQHQEVQG